MRHDIAARRAPLCGILSSWRTCERRHHAVDLKLVALFCPWLQTSFSSLVVFLHASPVTSVDQGFLPVVAVVVGSCCGEDVTASKSSCVSPLLHLGSRIEFSPTEESPPLSSALRLLPIRPTLVPSPLDTDCDMCVRATGWLVAIHTSVSMGQQNTTSYRGFLLRGLVCRWA